MTNPAMHTDLYEITMLDALIREGKHREPAVFEVFARRLSPGFRYGVVAGIDRLLVQITDFSFAGDAQYLREITPALSWDTLMYLRDFRFTGEITAYREGSLYFPYSPILTVSGEIGQCILLETLILSVLNHDSAIATKAARMVSVAQGRPIIEMGSRRTHEEAAVAAARAAYLVGFTATSNMAAGAEYNVPVTGTAAHAFTLAHESELEAFKAQIKAQGVGTTFLVDTYDVGTGIENAIQACAEAGGTPGAVRIDSGDLAGNARKARRLLDAAGCTSTKIVVTSDLDEHVMKDLKDAPIDGYGVGTQLVSTPPAGMVYKLVEINGRPVAKKSKDKISVGGRKYAMRAYGKRGEIVGEFTCSNPEGNYSVPNIEMSKAVCPQEAVMEEGMILTRPSLKQIRKFHQTEFETLPKSEQTVWSGEHGPFLTVEHIG